MSTTTCAIRSGAVSKTRAPAINWTKFEQHLRAAGAPYGGLYRLLQCSLPNTALFLCFSHRSPGILPDGAAFLAPRLGALPVVILLLAILLPLIPAAVGRRFASVIPREISGSLLAALLASLPVLAALAVPVDILHACTAALCFFAARATISLALLAAACVAASASVGRLKSRHQVLIAGSGVAAQNLFRDLADSPVFHVVAILDSDCQVDCSSPLFAPMRHRYLGPIGRLDQLLRERPISIVFCALPANSPQATQVLAACARIGVEVRHGIARPICVPSPWTRHSCKRHCKRLFDVVAGSVLLLLSLPVMLAAAVAIKLTGPGPVFFSQTRYGLHRRPFRIFKMRTMVADAESRQASLEAQNEMGEPVFKIRRDPRITRVGAFLRRTSIDELPQFWNVLVGDMSLVGPRPLAVRDFLRIQDSAHLRRFSVMPGISCIWQISGRNGNGFATWVRQDLQYIDSWSLLLDLRILAGTVPAVLRGRGAM